MKNAGKACNNRLYRHIRTFEKIVKNYFVIYAKSLTELRKKEEELWRDLADGIDYAAGEMTVCLLYTSPSPRDTEQ